MKILPLLELMRDTGFEPATKQYQMTGKARHGAARQESATSVFAMPAITMGTAQFALEAGLCLARRARAEDWDAQQLAQVLTGVMSQAAVKQGRQGKVYVGGKLLL